ncbi:MAG: hypothetical protein ACE1S7_00450 [Candidatus Tisiphia sp.]
MDRFDMNKAWGEVKKAYKFQTIVVLILVVTMFILVIPRVMPPAKRGNNEVSENKQVDKVDKRDNKADKMKRIVIRMMLAGFDSHEISKLSGEYQFENSLLRSTLDSMSDKQIAEFYNINIYELNSLRRWAEERKLCKVKLLEEKINAEKK